MGDIVETAVEAGSFKTLVSAAQTAGLVETLKGQGPFTVFAPDDEAFHMLPPGMLAELLNDTPKLKAILMYHVVPGKFTIDEIAQMRTIKTAQGQEVMIDAHKWHLHMNPKINDSNITSKDIVTDNGMIHVLNRVLMPNMELTCPVCSMGFMNMEELNNHTKMSHLAAMAPAEPMAPEPMAPAEPMPPAEPMEPAEVMPVVEKAPEPMATAEVMPEPVSPTGKTATGVFEIMLDADRKFRFHLKATNGLIIAASQSYGSREAAVKGIASIMKNAPVAKVADFTPVRGAMPEISHTGIVQDPVFEIICDVGGKFRFHLKAGNGLIIAASQSYGSREAAETGIASIKNNAPMARVVDHTMAAA
jgi:uncharacterized protein YegP (UPF0339 family)